MARTVKCTPSSESAVHIARTLVALGVPKPVKYVRRTLPSGWSSASGSTTPAGALTPLMAMVLIGSAVSPDTRDTHTAPCTAST